jgi:hypothetical protein
MVFGESVNLPMRVILNTLAAEYRPHSSSAQFSELWSKDIITPELMSTVYDRWRARSLLKDGSAPAKPNATARSVTQVRSQLKNSAPQATPQPQAAPQVAPAATGGISSQMRQRILAKASNAKPQSGAAPSLTDVKSMLNNAFNRDM